MLIGPCSSGFDEPKFIFRYISPLVQEYEGFWSPELIDKPGLVDLSFTESEFVANASADIRNDRLSLSDDDRCCSNVVSTDLKTHTGWVGDGFVWGNKDTDVLTSPSLLTKG
jgi:hypothetical protein